MRAINHALTGAVIGLAVSEPAIALPVALASHFVCDAIPHWASKQFDLGGKHFTWSLVVDALLCVALVAWLFFSGNPNWWLAAACAFLATSPDIFWFKRFWVLRKTGKYLPNKSWFCRFHGFFQWFQRPIGAWVEAVWFIAGLVVVGLML